MNLNDFDDKFHCAEDGRIGVIAEGYKTENAAEEIKSYIVDKLREFGKVLVKKSCTMSLTDQALLHVYIKKELEELQ